MSYCHLCDRPINGFDYGYGFNSVCGKCHKEELKQNEEMEVLKLEKKKLQMELKELRDKLK